MNRLMKKGMYRAKKRGFDKWESKRIGIDIVMEKSSENM